MYPQLDSGMQYILNEIIKLSTILWLKFASKTINRHIATFD